MASLIYTDVSTRNPELQLDSSVNINIDSFSSLAVVGPNGAGKSRFIDAIANNVALNEGTVELSVDGHKLFSPQIGYISFRDINRLTDSPDSYYQKRWNATENEDCPIVADILGQNRVETNMDLIRSLNIEHILPKHIIQISSGELRKLLIVRCLLKCPKAIIIDNPYIGLDAESRGIVNELLNSIISSQSIPIILVLCNIKDIPVWMDKIILFKDLKCVGTPTGTEFLNNSALQNSIFKNFTKNDVRLPEGIALSDTNYQNAIEMNKINIRYYNHAILKDIDWIVAKGETWALLGENGCGKSTLLSLVSGDNPQSYANDITLFDRKRGTGESIWDIKKHIGYLTPDMHTYYRENISCLDVVATGFKDTVGLFLKPSAEERAKALEWMRTFNADQLANKSFLKISYGEQRLILLCRLFVKTPDLLILDEPLHGLDQEKKLLVKCTIEKYCEQLNPTLIYVTHYQNEIPSVVKNRKILIKNRD